MKIETNPNNSRSAVLARIGAAAHVAKAAGVPAFQRGVTQAAVAGQRATPAGKQTVAATAHHTTGHPAAHNTHPVAAHATQHPVASVILTAQGAARHPMVQLAIIVGIGYLIFHKR